jgi:hypothetical protein
LKRVDCKVSSGGGMFRRRKVSPADAARDEILTIVSHHVEKGVIGIGDPTVKIPDDDPDDVGVD